MATSLALKTRMMTLTGWKSIRVQRDMEMMAAGFDLSLVSPAHFRSQAELEPYDRAEILLNEQPWLQGFIDEVEDSDEGERGEWKVRGRSDASLLVDCEAPVKTWRNATIAAIVNDICEHVGVAVSFRTPATATVRKFVIQEGECAAEAIRRLCSASGLLPQCDPSGGIKIEQTGAGTFGTPLTRSSGLIRRASRRRSGLDRFSSYTYKSQTAGDDNWSGAAASRIKFQVQDLDVLRYRPATFIADTEQSASELQTRAVWERNRRAGMSYTLRYTVSGWTFGAGIWEPNQIIPIDDSLRDVHGRYLLVGVVLVQEEEDQYAELNFCHPAAYSSSPTERVPWS